MFFWNGYWGMSMQKKLKGPNVNATNKTFVKKDEMKYNY